MQHCNTPFWKKSSCFSWEKLFEVSLNLHMRPCFFFFVCEDHMVFGKCVKFFIWTNLFQVHLIEGIIDQVEGTVHVSWVQPRVLGIEQIKSLRDRLDGWTGKVHTALLSIEAETPDLIGSWIFCSRFLPIVTICYVITNTPWGNKRWRDFRVTWAYIANLCASFRFVSCFWMIAGNSNLLYFASKLLVLYGCMLETCCISLKQAVFMH